MERLVGVVMKKVLVVVFVFMLFASSVLASNVAWAGAAEKIDVIIGFKDVSDAALVHSQGWKVNHEFRVFPFVACSVPVQAVEALKNNPKVAFVEEDAQVSALVDYDSSWGVVKIGAQTVASQGNIGEGINVAVIDTGINYNHYDLIGAYAGGKDFVNDDDDPMDDNGHGTHCAGIIAADNDNGFAVAGVAPGANIYALKVLDSQGSGYTSDIIAAIEWAIDTIRTAEPIQVISMSLGSSVGLTSLKTACDTAESNGIVVVAAAGNNGLARRTPSSISYPARYESVIAVGAVDQNNVRASFSSTGPELDLMAPGVNILSDYLNVDPSDGDWDTWTMSGTSMACPHVAGTAALVLKTDEASWMPYGYTDGDGVWGKGEVARVLIGTADGLGAAGFDNLYGNGLVDADEAGLTPAEPQEPEIETASYAPSAVTLTKGTLVSGDYLSLAADDASYLSVKSVRSGQSQVVDWYAKVVIAQAAGSVVSFSVSYDGHFSVERSQTVYLYNFAANTWQSISSGSVGTTDVPISFVTATPGNFISSLGEIRLRVYSTVKTSSAYTCYADSVAFTIDYEVP